MFDIYKWSVLIASTFFTTFGFFAYWRNRQDRSNQLFGLLSLVFAVWSYFWFVMLVFGKDVNSATLWARLLNLGATLIPVFFLHWILNLLDLYKKYRIFLLFGYFITLGFSFFSFSNLYISGVHSVAFFPFWPTAGPIYKWFLFFGYFIMVGFAARLLTGEFFVSQGEKKYQIGYVIVGSFLGFAGGLTNFPLMYGWNNFWPLVFVGIFLVMASPLVLSYAVIKHRLMDVKIITTEILSVFIAVMVLVDALLAVTRLEFFLKFGLFFGVAIFGFLLVRGVLNEIKSREKLIKMAESLKVANIELQKLDKAKTEFLNIASHQLRTPISVIKGITSMMIEGDLEKIPAEKKQIFIKGIWEKSQKLESIINDILNAAEMTNQEYTAKIKQDEHFDLMIFLREIIEEFQPLVKEREIDLVLDPASESVLISGEKEYLHEALSNLIDNAIKYTPSTGANSESRDKRSERGKIVVTVKKNYDDAIIEIVDNGMGIPAKEIPELFKKFSRASNARNMYTDGSGLGLFIVKEIIEGHGGRINLTSEINKGTAFHIKLPIRAPQGTDIKKYIIDKQQI